MWVDIFISSSVFVTVSDWRKMKKLTFSMHDFGMFDGELSAHEYEFFWKHTGAFKRLMKDEVSMSLFVL